STRITYQFGTTNVLYIFTFTLKKLSKHIKQVPSVCIVRDYSTQYTIDSILNCIFASLKWLKIKTFDYNTNTRIKRTNIHTFEGCYNSPQKPRWGCHRILFGLVSLP